MANVHFARIGDVWKHLPLAEILTLERPRRVWESHAGCAFYDLTPSYERDYGVYYLRAHAGDAAALIGSRYLGLLRSLETDGELRSYPGSPGLALHLLGQEPVELVFCDTDADSLADIGEAAGRLGISAARLRLVHDDGLATLLRLGAGLSPDAAAATLAHIDPYRPLVESRPGLNSLDLLCDLGARGVRCVLWYGYTSPGDRAELFDALQRALDRRRTSASALRVWYGDIRLDAIDEPSLAANTGVLSCGIITTHLGPRSRAACDRLGHALEQVYAGARLAGGHSGALRYTSAAAGAA